jgi:hypothetical protein
MADYRSTLNGLFDAARPGRKAFLALPPDQRPDVQAAPPFANSDHEHAEQIITKLVREAKDELLILAGKLSTNAHSSLRLRSHLLRNAELKIRIIVEGREMGPIFEDGRVDWAELRDSALSGLVLEESGEDGLLSRDADVNDSRLAIRVLPVHSPVHFVVSDGYSYRIEDNDELGAAVANQQDPATASSLVSKFNELWELSLPVQLPLLAKAAA